MVAVEEEVAILVILVELKFVKLVHQITTLQDLGEEVVHQVVDHVIMVVDDISEDMVDFLRAQFIMLLGITIVVI